MVVHIAMFKLKEENKAENLAKAVKMASGLMDMDYLISGHVEVNSPSAPQSNYDIALIVKLKNFQDLDTYQNDLQHQIFKKYIMSVAENRACIDYEA